MANPEDGENEDPEDLEDWKMKLPLPTDMP